jgi:uncharacterized delta-60 repeat protein
MHLGRFMSSGAADPAFLAFYYPSLLYAVTLDANGKLLIGGATFCRRLNTNGLQDGTFIVPPPNQPVRAIAVQPDGKILVGGNFSTMGGVSHVALVRLNPGGDIDPSFDAQMVTGAIVNLLQVLADGKFYVGGTFQTIGGANRNGFARLNADGSADTSFNAGTGFHSLTPVGVTSIAVQPNGKVLVGGGFVSVAGLPRRAIARLNPDGGVDPTFNAGAGPDGPVYALGLLPDGNLLIAGDFNNVNGQPRDRLARLFGDNAPPFSPELNVHARPDGQTEISFAGELGRRFTLEFTDALNTGAWSPGPPGIGNGGPLTLLDTNAPALQRFYRVRAE